MPEAVKEAHDHGRLPPAIRNPGNREHLRVIKPVEQGFRVYVGDYLVADTTDAIRVMEIGRRVYDPMIYVPTGDILATLESGTKETHCPLKGDASYLNFKDQEIGWTYNVYAYAARLDAHTAFWPAHVRLVLGD